VDGLIGHDTVNTLPPQTIDACADHCDPADRIELDLAAATAAIASLQDPDVNIDLTQVMEELLVDGIEKFVQPFEKLMASLQAKADTLVAVK
jgi:transaldolase